MGTSAKLPSYHLNLPFRPPSQVLLPYPPATNNSQCHSSTSSSRSYPPERTSFSSNAFPQPPASYTSLPVTVPFDKSHSAMIPIGPINDINSLIPTTHHSVIRKCLLYFTSTIIFSLIIPSWYQVSFEKLIIHYLGFPSLRANAPIVEKTRLPAKSNFGIGRRRTQQTNTIQSPRGKSVPQRSRIPFPQASTSLNHDPNLPIPLTLPHASNLHPPIQSDPIIIERQLQVICGPGSQHHDPLSQQPQIKYRTYLPVGEQRWRPNIQILDESFAGPEDTSLTWPDFLRFRVLEDSTPFHNWRQLYTTQEQGKRPLMRDCYVTSGWDNRSKQPIWLPRSSKDPGTLRNLLNMWFPHSQDRITIIFEYIPSHLPKVRFALESQSNSTLKNNLTSI